MSPARFDPHQPEDQTKFSTTDNANIQITSNLRDTRRRDMTMFVLRRARVNAAIIKRTVRDLERATLRFLRDLHSFCGGKSF